MRMWKGKAKMTPEAEANKPLNKGKFKKRDVNLRFLEKVKKTDFCWNWTGALCINKSGFSYGQLWVDNKLELAHRFSYRKYVGHIPKGWTVDHICKNMLCVNPDHLRVVTLRENILLGAGPSAINARKTHCNKGHEFTPKNIKKTKSGKMCRTCFNIFQSKWAKNKRLALASKESEGGK